MRVDRRGLLKAGALAGVAGAVPAAAASGFAAPALVVHDSRIAESRLFGKGQGLDLARGWDALRAHPGAARIEGLTGWSDYIALRGHFGDRGMRVMREDRIEAPLSRKTHLFRWTMVAR